MLNLFRRIAWESALMCLSTALMFLGVIYISIYYPTALPKEPDVPLWIILFCTTLAPIVTGFFSPKMLGPLLRSIVSGILAGLAISILCVAVFISWEASHGLPITRYLVPAVETNFIMMLALVPVTIVLHVARVVSTRIDQIFGG